MTAAPRSVSGPVSGPASDPLADPLAEVKFAAQRLAPAIAAFGAAGLHPDDDGYSRLGKLVALEATGNSTFRATFDYDVGGDNVPALLDPDPLRAYLYFEHASVDPKHPHHEVVTQYFPIVASIKVTVRDAPLSNLVAFDVRVAIPQNGPRRN